VLTSVVSPSELQARLREIGATRYHNRHPFHRAMRDGELTKTQVQAWALNRYAYQRAIPRKDALLLAKLDTPELRREWRRRLIDHDGDEINIGGVARWRHLAIGVGLAASRVDGLQGVLPATLFAVEAYVNFVRDRSTLEAVASSLTEMFSPTIISERVSGMLAHYDFVSPDILAYFTPRLTQAPRDVEFALEYVCAHADTLDTQNAVLAALSFKCDVLWAMLDALYSAYVAPGHIPPGAFAP